MGKNKLKLTDFDYIANNLYYTFSHMTFLDDKDFRQQLYLIILDLEKKFDPNIGGNLSGYLRYYGRLRLISWLEKHFQLARNGDTKNYTLHSIQDINEEYIGSLHNYEISDVKTDIYFILKYIKKHEKYSCITSKLKGITDKQLSIDYKVDRKAITMRRYYFMNKLKKEFT